MQVAVGDIWTRATVVWERLCGRFQLSQAGQTKQMTVGSEIVPITDADRLVKVISVATETTAVAATGNLTVFTVPAGERWVLRAHRFSVASGTWTMGSVIVTSALTGVTIAFRVASPDIDERFLYTSELELWPGDILGVNVNSFTGAGNLGGQLLREVWDVSNQT